MVKISPSHDGNLKAYKDSLINYSTRVAYYKDGLWYINVKKYSTTTSKIQFYIKEYLTKHNLNYTEYMPYS